MKSSEVEKALKLMKKNLAKQYNLNKTPSNIELLNYLSVKPKEIITKPTRTISGVAPIAIMTKPHKCPHIKTGIGPCIMCPGGIKSYFGSVPQSYTGKEPATMRAIRNNYDPYLQIFNRLEQYVLLNQNFEKTEIIIMGGTFPSLSKKYQQEFVTYIFKALNDFSELFFKDDKFDFLKFKKFFELPGDVKDRKRTINIHKKLLKLKKKSSLEKEQLKNENSKIKCVALCIETRPDYCTQKEINEMLKLGCTRVELGVQSIYDDVLEKINRGHKVNETIKATRLLKENGLKVIFHLIPGLPGSSYKKDLEMFKTIFNNDDFKPDGLKIYPCIVIKGTKLYNLWKNKKYIPLTLEKITKLLIEAKKFIPEYCRVMRVERDISSKVIEAGIKMTNLRQYIHEKGAVCRCIRCREIKNENIEKVEFKILEYNASNGKEYFISAESNDKIVGFCRLRLDKKAIIRELHVYGSAISLGKKGKIQHKGYGIKLMKIAENIAKKNYKKIFVIAGIGVKNYYKNKLGYKKDGFYMSKILNK